MSSGGQQPVTQQTQQTKDPWGPSQAGLQTAINQAMNYHTNDIGYQPWTGATQAGLDPRFLQGAQQLHAQLSPYAGFGTESNQAARGLATNMMQNQGLSPELKSLYEQAQGQQNPYLEGVIRQGVNQANAAASAGGRYGSGGHDAAITQAMSPVLAQDYQQRQQMMQQIATGGLERAGQWAQLSPTLDEAWQAPAKDLMALGQFYNERSQNALDDQIKLYNAQQARPWEQTARLNAIAGQAGALGGTQFGTQTTPINQPSTLQRLFGGAAAGAGIGGSFGGPVGAGVGALGGSLLGLL